MQIVFCFAGTNEEDEFYYESAELKELAFQLGEDPEELRDRVIRCFFFFLSGGAQRQGN